MAHKKSKSEAAYAARVGARGRLVLPAELRRRFRIEEGERLLFHVDPQGRLRVTTAAERVRNTRKILGRLVRTDRDLADELIRERREEAERE